MFGSTDANRIVNRQVNRGLIGISRGETDGDRGLLGSTLKAHTVAVPAPMTVVETPTFVREVTAALTEDERLELSRIWPRTLKLATSCRRLAEEGNYVGRRRAAASGEERA